MDFSDLVITQIKGPLDALCVDLMQAGELDQYLFFNGVSDMMGCIELGRCAFLGFRFSPSVEMQVTQILDRAIELSSMMSADNPH